MAATPAPKSLLVAVGLLFSLSQLHSTIAALYKVGDFSGKWGTDNYFQAGDSLSFVHHTKSADVHQVTREDYKACETVKPIITYRDTNNVAHLKDPATYYFISGIKGQCKAGRKLMVVVLQSQPAVTPATSPAALVPPPPPPATPPPATPPPAMTPTPSTPPPAATTPTPSTTPPSVTPASPSSPTPSVTPASPPTTTPPGPSPTTTTPSPATISPATTPASSSTPPAPAGPAVPPSPSSASRRDVRTWIVATVGLYSGLLLLL